MVRVNLLPPEVIEKRKAERRWVYIMYGSVALVVLLVVAYLVPTVLILGKQTELAIKQQQAADLQREADRYKIFEDKQADLQARKAVADRALASRLNWSRLLSELSLVLPSDVWLSSLELDQDTGLKMTGSATDLSADAPDSGHKTIAKMLVRLADLDQLTNVWLASSTKDAASGTLKFDVSASVSRDPTTTASVTAPPAQSAQNGQ